MSHDSDPVGTATAEPQRHARSLAPYRPASGWSAPASIAITLAIIAASIGGASALIGLMKQVPTRADGTTVMVLMGVSQTIMIALTLLAARRHGTRWADAFSLKPPAHGWKDYALGAVLIVATLVIVSAIAATVLGHDPLADLRQFTGVFKGDAWLLALVIVAIGAPLSEELLFRGFLQGALAKSSIGFVGGAAISIVLWTALHAGYSVVGMLEVVLIGVVFSFILWRSGSLRVSLVCHALYNGALALFTRFMMP